MMLPAINYLCGRARSAKPGGRYLRRPRSDL